MIHTNRFYKDQIEVVETTGNRTADGFKQIGTNTVLSCNGSLEDSGRGVEAQVAFYENGDVLFYTEESVAPVSTGTEATITTESGRTLEGVVEEVNIMSNSLLITLT